MAVLDVIPTELIIDVFDYTENVHLIVQVSRRLQSIVEPILYRSVNTHASDDERNGLFLAFGRTVVSRPMLGQHVWRLSLQWLEPDYSPFGQETFPAPFVEYLKAHIGQGNSALTINNLGLILQGVIDNTGFAAPDPDAENFFKPCTR